MKQISMVPPCFIHHINVLILNPVKNIHPENPLCSFMSQSLSYLLPPSEAIMDLSHHMFNHTVYSALDLASLTQHKAFKYHPSCMNHLFVLLYCWLVFHYTKAPEFVYPFTHLSAFGLCLVFGKLITRATYKHRCMSFNMNTSFQFI